ncbi:toll-like receptor 2 [Ptychodera flava]|uniref:toll-like receptor 2 n=1 Tax=Ptychodera flava TaxID=63121 RepID=UPI00396AAD47
MMFVKHMSFKCQIYVILWAHFTATSLQELHSYRCHQGHPETNRTDCQSLKPPLERIPAYLSNFTEELNLKFNDITSIRQGELTYLANLKHLTFRYNNIRLIEEHAFFGLSKVLDLDLARNKISSLSQLIFAGLDNLTSLDLSGNNISVIGNHSFAPLKNLEVLDLTSCGIQTITLDAFAGLTQLQRLTLSSNKLVEFKEDSLIHTFRLMYLSLNLNSLTQVPQRLCKYTPFLQQLSIPFNPIETLYFGEEFNKCSHLTLLGMGDVQSTINGSSFQPFNISLNNLEVFYSYLNTSGTPYKSFRNINYLRWQGPTSISGFDETNASALLSSALQEAFYTFDDANITTFDLYELTQSNVINLHTYFDVRWHIHSTTFQGLAKGPLQELKIRRTRLTLEDFSFKWMPQLKKLTLSDASLTTIPNKAFYGLSNLWYLDLGINTLTAIPTTALSALSSLQFLDLSRNPLHSLGAGALRGLTSLTNFQYSNDHASLRHLYMSFLTDVPSLERLKLTGCDSLHTDVANVKPMKNLTIADFARTRTVGLWVYRYLCYLPTTYPQLEYLDISGASGISFPDKPLGCTLSHVNTLKMDGIIMKTYETDPNPYLLKCFLFQSFPNLKILQLSKATLNQIDSGCFSNVSSLVYLDLSHNQIATITPSIWENLSNLVTLDLRSNNIQTVNSTTFADLPALKQLYLGGNPFACTCDIRWFYSWLMENPGRLLFQQRSQYSREIYWLQDYQCFSPSKYEGVYLVDFDISTMHCQSKLPLILGTVSAVLATVIVSSILVWQKFKWNIKYKLFLLKLKLGVLQNGYHPLEGKNVPKSNQIMVSYADENYHWVRHKMMTRFEEGDRFKLCIKDRDYIPGVAIATNIDECVHASDKVVFILSDDFIEDQFCIFELEMALQRLFDELRDVIILVELQPVPEDKLPRLIRLLKCRKKCFQWTDDTLGQEMFWTQLKLEIEKDSVLDHRVHLNLQELT